MPPPDHEPLLRAICADPADDTVRLAYADWLDENGDPDRAEFIRLHLDRGRAIERSRRDRRHIERITELRDRHEAAWRSELPRFDGITWGRLWRGFVSEAIAGRSTDLVRSAIGVFTASPIQFLQVRACEARTAEVLFGLDAFRQLLGLRIHAPMDPEFWTALISCPRLGNLRHLILDHPTYAIVGGDQRSDEWAAELARSTCLPKLEKLHFGCSVLSPDAEKALVRRFRLVSFLGFEPM